MSVKELVAVIRNKDEEEEGDVLVLFGNSATHLLMLITDDILTEYCCHIQDVEFYELGTQLKLELVKDDKR